MKSKPIGIILAAVLIMSVSALGQIRGQMGGGQNRERVRDNLATLRLLRLTQALDLDRGADRQDLPDRHPDRKGKDPDSKGPRRRDPGPEDSPQGPRGEGRQDPAAAQEPEGRPGSGPGAGRSSSNVYLEANLTTAQKREIRPLQHRFHAEPDGRR